MTKSEFIIELLKFRDPGLGRSVENLVNQALKDAPELTTQSALEEKVKRYWDFYWFMRTSHSHTEISEVAGCKICEALEMAKEPEPLP